MVELLVVITIIGMLMGLILPAIQGAREHGRRIKCVNNLHQLSLAAMNLESSQGTFPGFENTVNGQTLSWAIMLLPYMERTDLWNLYKGTAPVSTGTASNVPNLQLFICPSDPPTGATNGPSSYTANGWVFQDGTNSNYQGLSQSGIRDGASMTLMISENLQLYSTTSGGTVSGGTAAHSHSWADTTPMNVSFGYGTPPAASNIVNANSYPQTMVDNIESNHSVGACAAFCDGHVILLRGDTDCASATSTFEQLVNPNDMATGSNAILDESKFSFPL
ncbi:MAG: DUF1559 domain-containing protein [Thermoguttaceae bacterium]